MHPNLPNGRRRSHFALATGWAQAWRAGRMNMLVMAFLFCLSPNAAGSAADLLGLPAESFPPLTGTGALETQARITLEAPVILKAGSRAEITGTLSGSSSASKPIRLQGSVGFEADANGEVSARVIWTRRLGDTGALNSALASRMRGPAGSAVPAGTTLTIVGDIDALRAGIIGFAVSLNAKVRGGCPDLIHYSRGAVVAQTRNYRITPSGKTLHSDCSPDVAAGLWRIERDYRGCDWQPGDQDKVYPSYRLVYRPFGTQGPMTQIQSCLPDLQMPSAPFGITIAGCPQIPHFPTGGVAFGSSAGSTTSSTTASQRYGWTTTDGVFRGLTPCLDQVPVTLTHERRSCSLSSVPPLRTTGAFQADAAGVTMAETYVQTDVGSTTFRKLLPCIPWGENIVKDARECSGQMYDDMVGGVSFGMTTYGVIQHRGSDGADSMTPLTGCLPDPDQMVVQQERQVGWHHADGVLASFPVMQRSRAGIDIGATYIGDPAQAYTLEDHGVVNAGEAEQVGCITYQARQRMSRYKRPDDSVVDLLGIYEAPVVTDNCVR